MTTLYLVSLFWALCRIGADSAATDTASVQQVVLRFGGDVLLGGYYEVGVGDSGAGAFTGFAGLAAADVAMVNLENPVTIRGTRVPKPYNFRMHPKYLRALVDAGIDIVCIANNHVFDYGREGFFDTISYLDSVRVQHVGAGKTREDAHRPVVLDVRGRRIGFLAYYGGGEAPGAGPRSPGVARRDPAEVTADIRNLRDHLHADYIVVNLHWGTEKAERPDAEQVFFAHTLIDAGADAVVGHHPHVLQGIEVYKSKVIAYSLGNFIFGGNSRSTYDTGLLEIRLEGSAAHAAFLPVRVQEWRATMMSGRDSTGMIERVKKLSSQFPKSIFTK